MKNRLSYISVKKCRAALLAASAAVAAAPCASALDDVIVSTGAYSWHGDTITQGEYMAYAPDDYTILSTYHAQPGYFMPVSNEWHRRNDLSAYPRLSSSNRLHNAIYNMGLDEMVNAVEPDTTLRTGKEWAGVWTRDVSYSILLSMSYMQPEASRISLERKITPDGRIIQDTGSGGAWPVSSDREVWALAAYELYKVTGDRDWLVRIYPVIRRSLHDDLATVYTAGNDLPHGETSFIDWREQSHPKWMQTVDVYGTQALGTSVVHAQAWNVLADIAAELGDSEEAAFARNQADKVAAAINRELWDEDRGDYMMYLYGRDFPIVNPRHETLGTSLAILYGIADDGRARRITASNPVTPFGPAIFFPQISDMPAYHNNALWPWVGAYWTLANARAGNEEGVLHGIGSVFRPAALFATNKENFNLDNGDIATELNSSNMLWCLAGNIAITTRVLIGIQFEKDGLRFSPFVPKSLADTRRLDNFRYRDATLNITVSGYGDSIASFKLNGREHAPFIPADIKGINDIVITMADNDIEPVGVNFKANVKAPLTPVAWLEGETLVWNPIEYIGSYVVLKDGKEVARTRQTSYGTTEPGEYQVIGISADGVPSFASQPRSTRAAVSIEVPGAVTEMRSPEISYLPASPVAGYTGGGFVEIDRTTPAVDIPFTVADDGTYSLSLRYANGNGPVNTENKCAIRTVSIDGRRLGVFVMPQRGVANWDDWGLSNPVHADLAAGQHTLTISYEPTDANMNGNTNHALVDRLIVVRL